MRLTFLGHAGWLAQTRYGSVPCDPWFTPAYFGSWFPFPRNDNPDPDDGSARVLDQNDARPGDLDALRSAGPFDAQLLQFSGAIWFPIAYDFPPAEKDRLARAKRSDEMERAQRFIEAAGATHVFPCA